MLMKSMELMANSRSVLISKRKTTLEQLNAIMENRTNYDSNKSIKLTTYLTTIPSHFGFGLNTVNIIR